MSTANSRVLITGANGAMAMETIKHLLNDGYKDIVMAVRTEAKGHAARQEIIASRSESDIDISVVSGFDMNKPDSIKYAIGKMSGKPFDIVFLAAGFAVFAEDYQSVEYNGLKIEKTVFQNLVGSHVVFTALKERGLIAEGARVVLAGGEGARGIKGMIDKPEFASAAEFRDYILLKDVPKYNPMNAIGVSKFVGALWVRKMAEVERDNMQIVWFSPGLTSGSAGLKQLPFAKRTIFSLMFGLMNLLGQSQKPSAGGRKYADCLIGKVGNNGALIGAPAGKSLGPFTDQLPLNPQMDSENLKEELWHILAELRIEGY